jgi:hypothetical protein
MSLDYDHIRESCSVEIFCFQNKTAYFCAAVSCPCKNDYSITLFFPFSLTDIGRWIRTLDLRIISQVFYYYYVTRTQLFH